MIALVACGHSSEPAKVERPARDARAADARLADAAARPVVADVIAKWSDKPGTLTSPACIVGGADRFIQYADLDEKAALRFCLWWNLGKRDFPDVGCWRVELATGNYDAQTGVWFSAPQPARVGLGGGAARSLTSSRAIAPSARWRDDELEICRGAACTRVRLPKSADGDEVVFDDQGQLAVVPLGRSPSNAKAKLFATIDPATGTQLATLTIADRHQGAEAIGFVGPSLVVTDCDDKLNTCAWDLYDPHTGARIAAVGGARPLGAGGTAVAIDVQRFAAVAGTHLVVQDATSGKVTASIELPRTPKLHADDVVFLGDGGLVVPGPDGRVVLVDPAAGKITRTIMPPPCTR